MPAGRMLNKPICSSEKINSLSPFAALLFSWCVMFEDSAGYIEAEPSWLKANIFPMRDELSVNDITRMVIEIVQVGAWEPFLAKDDGKRWVWDPKFEEHQTNRRKDREAPSKFVKRGPSPSYEILEMHIGLDPVPLENITEVWNKNKCSKMESGSKGLQLPPKEKKESKESKVNGEAKKPLSLKRILEEDHEMNDLVTNLRKNKWPEVGSFLGKCLKEIKSIRVEDLKQTLQVVMKQESFDESKGGAFAFAKGTLQKIIAENTSKRVAEQAQEFKKDEAQGLKQIGDVLKDLQKGESHG